MDATARSERVHARVTPPVKALLQQAADLSGRSPSDFLVRSAQEVAEKTTANTGLSRLPPRIAWCLLGLYWIPRHRTRS